MSHLFSPRRRKLFAFAAAFPVLVVATVVSNVPSASAWHADVAGTADCRGVVSFTATSWTGGISGANTKVLIEYSTDVTTFKPVVADTAQTITSNNGIRYEFTTTNKNSFSDSFQLPSPWSGKVTVKATTLGTWGGSHGKDVQSRSTIVDVPLPCAQPTVTIAPPRCTSPDAVVTLTNGGDGRASFTLHKGNAIEPFETHEVAGKATETVKLAVSSDFKLSVHAKGIANVEADLKPAKGCDTPLVTVEPMCALNGGGWHIVFQNDGATEQEFLVKSGDKTLDTVRVAARAGQTKSYTFASLDIGRDKEITLDVVTGGKVIATKQITNDCVDVAADITTKCDTAAGSGAVLTFTNRGKLDETFTVVRDGRSVAGSPFVLHPGEPDVQKLLRLNEDENAVIRVTTGSGSKVEKSVRLDCTDTASVTVSQPPPAEMVEVLSETVTRAQLAETGESFAPMVALGAFLLALGSVTLLSRRLTWVR